MTDCCWNVKNGHPMHNSDCLVAYGPINRPATMAVTFMDGETIIYKNVLVCINRPGDDGIRIDGTSITFEAGDVPFTLLGVRQFTYELDD
jgi:hypothetical protein